MTIFINRKSNFPTATKLMLNKHLKIMSIACPSLDPSLSQVCRKHLQMYSIHWLREISLLGPAYLLTACTMPCFVCIVCLSWLCLLTLLSLDLVSQFLYNLPVRIASCSHLQKFCSCAPAAAINLSQTQVCIKYSFHNFKLWKKELQIQNF